MLREGTNFDDDSRSYWDPEGKMIKYHHFRNDYTLPNPDQRDEVTELLYRTNLNKLLIAISRLGYK